MVFKTMDDVKGLKVKDILCKISQSSSSSDLDGELMANFARKVLDYPNAKAVYGIMYLNPPNEQPMGVNQFAQMVIKTAKLIVIRLT